MGDNVNVEEAATNNLEFIKKLPLEERKNLLRHFMIGMTVEGIEETLHKCKLHKVKTGPRYGYVHVILEELPYQYKVHFVPKETDGHQIAICGTGVYGKNRYYKRKSSTQSEVTCLRCRKMFEKGEPEVVEK